MDNGSQSLPTNHSPKQNRPGHPGPGGYAPPVSVEFVGVSTPLRRLLLQAEIAAPRLQFAALEGEAGTGKHLLAQTIHRLSKCAELPFRRHDAREWLANDTDPNDMSGTLYLDRVDLLAPIGQGLLLNFIKNLQADVLPNFLLLASSHTSLRLLAGQSQFLPDLAFRLSAARFQIPPLRDHREDIAPLAQLLIDRICRHYHQSAAILAAGTLSRLLRHSWPGNVRELASVIESAVLDSTSGIIRPTDLIRLIQSETAPAPSSAAPPSPQRDLPGNLTLDAAIQHHLRLVLELNRGNKLRAARQLGISRSTLYRLLAGENPTQNPVLSA
jgi:DNA-binding NtrC family response regulator